MLIPFNGNMYDVGLYLTLLDQEALEHLVHIEGVTGSNPVSTTKTCLKTLKATGLRQIFLYGIIAFGGCDSLIN